MIDLDKVSAIANGNSTSNFEVMGGIDYNFIRQMAREILANAAFAPPMNDLSNAEVERLAILVEEAGEVAQMVGKTLRHGYDSKHPDDLSGPDNREMLGREVGDFDAALGLMIRAGDLRSGVVGKASVGKSERLKKWTHYQGKWL